MSLSWTERVRAGSYVLTGVGGYVLCTLFPPGFIALGALALFLGWQFRADVAYFASHVKPALAGVWAQLKPPPKPVPLFGTPSPKGWASYITPRAVVLVLCALALLFILNKCAPVFEFISRPFDWLTTSREELRVKNDQLQSELESAQDEVTLRDKALELQTRTHEVARYVDETLAEATEDLQENAQDYALLYRSYSVHYDRLWLRDNDPNPSASDPAPRRPNAMHEASARS